MAKMPKKRFKELGLGYTKEDCACCDYWEDCPIWQELNAIGKCDEIFCWGLDEERLAEEMTDAEYDAWRHGCLEVAR
jgi:hypothetical protein